MKITKILEGFHDSVDLLDVPVRRTYRQRKKKFKYRQQNNFPKSLHFFEC